MLLGEPPRTVYDLNFALFNIPIRVHPLFWLVSVILGAQSRDGIGILTWTAAVFFSILIHELGHAGMMQALGFRPWIVLYGMGGLTSHDSRSSFRSKKIDDSLGEILISAAGPFAGFALAAFLVLVVYVSGHGDQVVFTGPWHLQPMVWLSNARLTNLMNDVLYICVLWGLVNLLPIYPLDGGQIARELFLRYSPGDGIRQSMLLSMYAAVGMAAYGLIQWNSAFVAFFFGYLAYTSYIAMQSYGGRNRW